jgi:hypothetical protein
MKLGRNPLHFGWIGFAKALVIVGAILAGVNFVLLNLPAIFMVSAFFLILASLLYMYEKDFRKFRKMVETELKKPEM